MKEVVSINILAIIITFIGIILLAILLNPLFKKACEEGFRGSDLEYKYGFWSGCLVKTDKGWIPSDNYFINRPDEQENK